jgi:hypothetical protein
MKTTNNLRIIGLRVGQPKPGSSVYEGGLLQGVIQLGVAVNSLRYIKGQSTQQRF